MLSPLEGFVVLGVCFHFYAAIYFFKGFVNCLGQGTFTLKAKDVNVICLNIHVYIYAHFSVSLLPDRSLG